MYNKPEVTTRGLKLARIGPTTAAYLRFNCPFPR